jgi:signal transduction histidine kinase
MALRPSRARVTCLISAVVTALVGSFAWWDPLDIDDRATIRRSTLQFARSIRADLAANMRARISGQVRLAARWKAPQRSTEEWKFSSRQFLDDYPGSVLIASVDPDYEMRWAVARDNWHDGSQLDVITAAPLRPVLETAFDGSDDATVISPAFQLPDGRTAASMIVPFVRTGVVAGLLVEVFDVSVALESMLADYRGLGYSASVTDRSGEIFRLSAGSSEHERKWAQIVDLELPGVTWRIRAWPDPHTMDALRSSLPEAGFVLMGLLGFMLMVAVRSRRASDSSAKELGQARDELELRVRERNLELQRINSHLEEQIMERTRAEDSLRKLSGRLLQLQDEERRRIVRDLHDGTGQTLGAIAMNLERAQGLMQNCAHAAMTSLLRESIGLLECVTLEIRTLSYLLHPPMLDDLGLQYVLAWYATGFAARSGLTVRLAIQPNLGRLPPEIELTLFRIAQEALTNTHRHSGSGTASVTLSRESASVRMEIKDQGRGIRPGLLDLSEPTITSLGVGIIGMRERVRQLAGRLEITSGPNGTTIRTILPLPPAPVAG